MDRPPSPCSKDRFSDRVENYIRYRPTYPPEIIDLLERETGLSPTTLIADIGSGTGISSELFLTAGFQVIGIEPNREMREAAERLLEKYPAFTSINGSAQETTLVDHSIDLIVAAQAFHWFYTPETRAEFDRILKPTGKIALIWNERKLDTTAFLRDYEALLLRFGTDYSEIRHENVGANLADFFHGPMKVSTFANEQLFDFEGVKGRLLSSSYASAEGHPQHQAMIAELQRIFDLHHENGRVAIEYKTELYIGR